MVDWKESIIRGNGIYMLDLFTGFWGRNGEDIVSDLIVAFVAFILGYGFKSILKGIHMLVSWFKKKILQIPINFRKFKVNREYKKTIKLIERLEIPVTESFLFGKTKEKNPELKKIFEMMDEGLIEAPPLYKLSKTIKDRGIKLPDNNVLNNIPPKINLFDPNKYLEK